mmetsp:Transcript_37447/g.123520  ORF Transcript_37447/g.123520 Transcript_37447/m.123520 type:complete len:345 (+) Transcript_37447:755-1789(+)
MVAETFDASIRFHTGGLFAVRDSCSCALAQTSRHSGSEISSLARSSAGSRSGTNGAISYGSSQSLAMFSTMRAELRLIEVVGTSKPRLSSGCMSASAEPSMSVTKTTPASACTVSAVFSGSRMQSMISGMKPVMSLLVTVVHASRIASVAASLTCGLVSHMSPLRTGMTSVRWRAICFGCFLERLPSIWARPRLPCHLPSHSASTIGMTKRSAFGDSVSPRVVTTSFAASCTGFILSESASMTSGSIGAIQASPEAPSLVSRALSAISEAARWFALALPLSASSDLRLAMSPDVLRDSGPPAATLSARVLAAAFIPSGESAERTGAISYVAMAVGATKGVAVVC